MPATKLPPAPTGDSQPFSADEASFYQRYLIFQQGVEPEEATPRQISTAGYEASGTSNMKFMMNGALTVGTRDGATVEMAREAGEENFFLFGLTAEQVLNSRGWCSPHWHYDHEPETRAALDLIFSDYFSRREPGIFAPVREFLLDQGDYYMHLADLTSYSQAQARVGQLYEDMDAWSRKAILNVGYSGKFSSDRAIQEYAASVWNIKPCPLPSSFQASQDGAILGRRGQSVP